METAVNISEQVYERKFEISYNKANHMCTCWFCVHQKIVSEKEKINA